MKPQNELELYQQLFLRDPLKAAIFLYFTHLHRGVKRAIARDEFRARYKLEHKINDRAFRQFYSTEIPVAYVNMKGKRGIYWPDKPRDMRPIKDLRKKALSMLWRVKNIEDKHRELIQYEQMGLPLEDEAQVR